MTPKGRVTSVIVTNVVISVHEGNFKHGAQWQCPGLFMCVIGRDMQTQVLWSFSFVIWQLNSCSPLWDLIMKHPIKQTRTTLCLNSSICYKNERLTSIAPCQNFYLQTTVQSKIQDVLLWEGSLLPLPLSLAREANGLACVNWLLLSTSGPIEVGMMIQWSKLLRRLQWEDHKFKHSVTYRIRSMPASPCSWAPASKWTPRRELRLFLME